MASSAEVQTSKLSFAKVAASAYALPIPSTSAASPDIQADIPVSSPDPVDGNSSRGSTDIKVKTHLINGSALPASSPRRVSTLIGGARRDRPVIASSLGESQTQSSSNISAHAASLDGKSAGSGSGTTFALDEKESLRPDDSASARAIDEEDISAPGSAAAESRIGSDSGVRHFRDQLQLREMDLGAESRPLEIPSRATSSNEPEQPSEGAQVISEADVDALRAGIASSTIETIKPELDSKLKEAMDSPKDRIFVLKLEQDIVDFLKDPQETQLSLPQCNSFYRLLAHRLADYYSVGHAVDSATNFSTVRLFKNVNAKMPPPLCETLGLYNADNGPSTEPARKIMRRGGSKPTPGTSTTDHSEAPSKATSEVGEASGSDLGRTGEPKSKQALTREEREAKYKEARLRIFGVESQNNNEKTNGDAKETSRSSSAAEKKKSKKYKSSNNDDFEARSQYAARLNQQSQQTYAANNGYPSYPSNAVTYCAGLPATSPTYATFAHQPQPEVQHQPNVQWQPAQGNAMQIQGYQYTPGYDMSADFQRGMHSFQTAEAHVAPTPQHQYTAAQYPMNLQPTQQQSLGWPQPGYQPFYPNGQPPLSPMGFTDVQQPAQGYPFYQGVQSSRSPLPSGRPQLQQQPFPGSFGRGQFNPHSQSFVPSFAPGQFQATPQGYQSMPGYQNMATPYLNSGPHVAGYQIPPPPTQYGAANMVPVPRPNGVPQANGQSPSLQNSSPASIQSAIPARSSLAKWGTPAHLPPKPPPQVTIPPNRSDGQRPIQPPPVLSTPPRHPGSGLAPGVDATMARSV